MSRRISICLVVFAISVLSCLAADRILFMRLGPAEATLYISNADGTEEHALTQPGALDYNPAWSPKADWIAFTSERSGSADIYRVHPDGTGIERLTDNPAFDDQAAFSPDGKQIVFVSTRAAGYANLWTLDVATRKAKPLSTGNGGDFRPSWSPDGRWIAFSSDRESDLPPAKGRWERLHLVDIYIVHPDGTGLKRITQHGDFCGSPKWTANSKSVVTYCMSAEETWGYRAGTFEGDDKLMQIDIGTGEATPFTAGPGVKLAPAILPSGQIAYLRRGTSSPGIFYGEGKPGPAGANLRAPSWSPDGLHLVYSRYKSPQERIPEPKSIWSRNTNFKMYGTAWLPSYDRTGDRFAVSKISAAQVSSLLIVEEGKPAHTIYESKELLLAPQWSPDGKQIVFGIGAFTAFLDFAAGGKKPVDPVNGGAQVAIINADGTGFRVITKGPNNNAFPSFSPDGQHIVYRTAGPDGEGLRIMGLDGHAVMPLSNLYDNFPVWSPRGNLIAFIRRTGGNFEVFTIHPDGTDLKQLTNTRGNEAHLAWSPDGERLLFSSTRMGFKDEALYTGSPQPYGEIFVMRYDGTHIEQLTDNQWEEGGPAWQPQKALASQTATRKP